MKRRLPAWFFVMLFFLVWVPFSFAKADDAGKFISDLSKRLEPELAMDGNTLHNGLPLKAVVVDPNPPGALRKILPPQAIFAGQSMAAATFSISYVTDGGTDKWGQACTTFPEAAKTVFEAAADVWANILQSDVPITISACWANLGSSTTLGYSGGGPLHRDFTGNIRSNTWFSGALANSLYGSDLSTSSYDMHITYNTNFNWYYGTNGNPGIYEYDLFTVVLHEIAHGLNFSGSMKVFLDVGSWGYGTSYPQPNIYDVFMRDSWGNVLISTYTSGTPDLAAVLTSNDLYFHGTNAMAANGSARVKMYAPAAWASGSSYSHFDYATFNNTSNQLMVYAISAGEAIHDPGAIARGLFEDIGWSLTSGSDCTSLADGVGESVSVGQDEEICYTIDVPEGSGELSVVLDGLSADVDLYTRYGDMATTSDYDCRSNLSGTDSETCTHIDPTAGQWYVMVYGTEAGSGNLTATVADPVCGAPVSVSVPENDVDGDYTVSWDASSTSGVTYEVEEATDETFTTDLRTAYSGTDTSASITGRSDSLTYYYRVKATRSGYTDSSWQTGANGCYIGFLPDDCTGLTSGVGVSVSLASGEEACYFIDVVEGVDELSVALDNLSADLDLYTGFDEIPSSYKNDCSSNNLSTEPESCVHIDPEVGVWYIRVYGYEAGSGILTATAINYVCNAPSSITVPSSDDDGDYTVNWGTSSTSDVTYELEEATDSNFTADLRTAYSGTETSASITGRSNGVSYYYRVKATRSGYEDSTWQSAATEVVICSYTIDPVSYDFDSSGGLADVHVTAAAVCSWSVSESLDWVTVTDGASGSGNGTVTYWVDENTNRQSRSGGIGIAGLSHTISQEATTVSIMPILHLLLGDE